MRGLDIIMADLIIKQKAASILLGASRKAGSILRNGIKGRLLAASFASCGPGFRIGKGCEIVGNSNVVMTLSSVRTLR